MIHSQPHSIASAANQASVTRDPRVSVSMHSPLKISQCRSPGSTIWQWGCPSRFPQNPNASSIALDPVPSVARAACRTVTFDHQDFSLVSVPAREHRSIASPNSRFPPSAARVQISGGTCVRSTQYDLPSSGHRGLRAWARTSMTVSTIRPRRRALWHERWFKPQFLVRTAQHIFGGWPRSN